MAAPIPAAVGASNLTATTAILVGSVNPQGQTGTCWFNYGTSPSLGTTTPSQTLPATTIPQTITAPLTGLTPGVQYWFAMVADTTSTVTSTSLTFTPNTTPLVTDASIPLTPVAAPPVTTPHFSFPFTLDPDGARVAEQDSFEEIISCVQAIATCPLGACPDLPRFGIPDPTFLPGPPDATSLVDVIELWERRADETAVVQALDQLGSSWSIALTTQVTGTGQ